MLASKPLDQGSDARCGHSCLPVASASLYRCRCNTQDYIWHKGMRCESIITDFQVMCVAVRLAALVLLLLFMMAVFFAKKLYTCSRPRIPSCAGPSESVTASPALWDLRNMVLRVSGICCPHPCLRFIPEIHPSLPVPTRNVLELQQRLGPCGRLQLSSTILHTHSPPSLRMLRKGNQSIAAP